jgi:hypothetical protein
MSIDTDVLDYPPEQFEVVPLQPLYISDDDNEQGQEKDVENEHENEQTEASSAVKAGKKSEVKKSSSKEDVNKDEEAGVKKSDSKASVVEEQKNEVKKSSSKDDVNKEADVKKSDSKSNAAKEKKIDVKKSGSKSNATKKNEKDDEKPKRKEKEKNAPFPGVPLRAESPLKIDESSSSGLVKIDESSPFPGVLLRAKSPVKIDKSSPSGCVKSPVKDDGGNEGDDDKAARSSSGPFPGVRLHGDRRGDIHPSLLAQQRMKRLPVLPQVQSEGRQQRSNTLVVERANSGDATLSVDAWQRRTTRHNRPVSVALGTGHIRQASTGSSPASANNAVSWIDMLHDSAPSDNDVEDLKVVDDNNKGGHDDSGDDNDAIDDRPPSPFPGIRLRAASEELDDDNDNDNKKEAAGDDDNEIDGNDNESDDGEDTSTTPPPEKESSYESSRLRAGSQTMAAMVNASDSRRKKGGRGLLAGLTKRLWEAASESTSNRTTSSRASIRWPSSSSSSSSSSVASVSLPSLRPADGLTADVAEPCFFDSAKHLAALNELRGAMGVWSHVVDDRPLPAALANGRGGFESLIFIDAGQQQRMLATVSAMVKSAAAIITPSVLKQELEDAVALSHRLPHAAFEREQLRVRACAPHWLALFRKHMIAQRALIDEHTIRFYEKVVRTALRKFTSASKCAFDSHELLVARGLLHYLRTHHLDAGSFLLGFAPAQRFWSALAGTERQKRRRQRRPSLLVQQQTNAYVGNDSDAGADCAQLSSADADRLLGDLERLTSLDDAESALEQLKALLETTQRRRRQGSAGDVASSAAAAAKKSAALSTTEFRTGDFVMVLDGDSSPSSSSCRFGRVIAVSRDAHSVDVTFDANERVGGASLDRSLVLLNVPGGRVHHMSAPMASLLTSVDGLLKLIDDPVVDFFQRVAGTISHRLRMALWERELEPELLFDKPKQMPVRLADGWDVREWERHVATIVALTASGDLRCLFEELDALICAHASKLCNELAGGARLLALQATDELHALHRYTQLKPGNQKSHLVALWQTIVEESKRWLQRLHAAAQQLIDGGAKQELTDWWLTLIDVRVEQFLVARGFRADALPDDYIAQAPDSLDVVDANLSLVRSVLDIGANAHNVDRFVQPLKDEIYAQIDLFCAENRALAEQYLGVDAALPDTEWQQRVRDAIAAAPKDDAVLTPAIVGWLDDYIDDEIYIGEMKQMEADEFKQQGDVASDQRLRLAKVTPISGIIVGKFAMIENEHSTCLELYS